MAEVGDGPGVVAGEGLPPRAPGQPLSLVHPAGSQPQPLVESLPGDLERSRRRSPALWNMTRQRLASRKSRRSIARRAAAIADSPLNSRTAKKPPTPRTAMSRPASATLRGPRGRIEQRLGYGYDVGTVLFGSYRDGAPRTSRRSC